MKRRRKRRRRQEEEWGGGGLPFASTPYDLHSLIVSRQLPTPMVELPYLSLARQMAVQRPLFGSRVEPEASADCCAAQGCLQ